MEKLEYVSCDLCGSSHAKEIYPASLDKNLQGSNFSVFGELGQHHRVVRCLSCDLVFSNPRDPKKGLDQKYAELTIEEYLSAKQSRALTSAKDVRLVQKYCKSGKLLDIGCSTGIFLSQLPKSFTATGVELSRAACEKAKADLPEALILNGAIDEIEFDNSVFDVITMWDVIEHLPSPTETISSLTANLAPGGHIFIVTPNFKGFMSRLMQRKWPHLIRGHLYYYDKKTIKKILEKCGLEIVLISGYSRNFRVSYILKRLKLISNTDFFERFLRYLNLELRINLGDALMIVAKNNITK